MKLLEFHSPSFIAGPELQIMSLQNPEATRSLLGSLALNNHSLLSSLGFFVCLYLIWLHSSTVQGYTCVGEIPPTVC